SVSLSFKLCIPEKIKGTFLKQQVAAKVCARSGSFIKLWKNFLVFLLLLRIIIPSTTNSVDTPRSTKRFTTLESPCILSFVNPSSLISDPGSRDAISYQYEAAVQSASTVISTAL